MDFCLVFFFLSKHEKCPAFTRWVFWAQVAPAQPVRWVHALPRHICLRHKAPGFQSAAFSMKETKSKCVLCLKPPRHPFFLTGKSRLTNTIPSFPKSYSFSAWSPEKKKGCKKIIIIICHLCPGDMGGFFFHFHWNFSPHFLRFNKIIVHLKFRPLFSTSVITVVLS